MRLHKAKRAELIEMVEGHRSNFNVLNARNAALERELEELREKVAELKRSSGQDKGCQHAHVRMEVEPLLGRNRSTSNRNIEQDTRVRLVGERLGRQLFSMSVTIFRDLSSGRKWMSKQPLLRGMDELMSEVTGQVRSPVKATTQKSMQASSPVSKDIVWGRSKWNAAL